MGHEAYHEQFERLSDTSKEMHRCIVSLIEELEAIDWYQQRADVTSNADLKEVLLHNMEEEIEHGSMLLEWLQRSHDQFDKQLRKYLFTRGNILQEEEGDDSGGSPGPGRAKG